MEACDERIASHILKSLARARGRSRAGGSDGEGRRLAGVRPPRGRRRRQPSRSPRGARPGPSAGDCVDGWNATTTMEPVASRHGRPWRNHDAAPRRLRREQPRGAGDPRSNRRDRRADGLGFSIKPNEIMVLTKPPEPRVYAGVEDAADRYFREKGIDEGAMPRLKGIARTRRQRKDGSFIEYHFAWRGGPCIWKTGDRHEVGDRSTRPPTTARMAGSPRRRHRFRRATSDASAR